LEGNPLLGFPSNGRCAPCHPSMEHQAMYLQGGGHSWRRTLSQVPPPTGGGNTRLPCHPSKEHSPMNSSPDAPWKCPGSAKYWKKKFLRRGTRFCYNIRLLFKFVLCLGIGSGWDRGDLSPRLSEGGASMFVGWREMNCVSAMKPNLIGKGYI